MAIVLLNWRKAAKTVRCIRSVRQLDYPCHDLIVVDNGSPDDSVATIERECSDVRVVQTGANLGFAGGCNVGIRRALGDGADYVWLLNNDTTVDPASLAALVRVAESDPAIGCVGSVLNYMDTPERVQAWGGGRVNMWLGTSTHFHSAAHPPPDYITGASMLLRRQAIEQVGLLDDRFFMYWEDTDYCFRLRKAGWRLSIAADSVILHEEGGSTGPSSPLHTRYATASSIRFFRKHSAAPLIPIGVSVGVRFVRRLLRGNWADAAAVWNGVKDGLRSATVRPGA